MPSNKLNSVLQNVFLILLRKGVGRCAGRLSGCYLA